GPALAAVLLGPADAEPAVLAHLADGVAEDLAALAGTAEALTDLGGQQLGEVRAQLVTQCFLLGGVGEEHGVAPGRGEVPSGLWQVAEGQCLVEAGFGWEPEHAL